MAKYQKALALVAVTVATFITSVLTDGITPAEWAMVAATGLAAVGTHLVPNLPAGPAGYAKTAVTFATHAATALALVVAGGVTGGELIEVLVTAAASIGLVAVVPNVGDYRARAAVATVVRR